MRKFVLLLALIVWMGCQNGPKSSSTQVENLPVSSVSYAKGFTIEHFDRYAVITLTNPWPGSDATYRYLLKKDTLSLEKEKDFDAVVHVPLSSMVVTSTTHIPSLEMLRAESKLVGFPNLDYISSPKTRALIEDGNITELGKNEDINTEVLIDLQPDAVVTFAVEGANKTVATIQKTGIPVLYNSDWTEIHPLGKAEWIKFFGALFQKEREADSIFASIEKNYNEAKTLASKAAKKPTVLSGAMFKDVWYLPQGGSWAAQFIDDAHGEYLWSNTEGTGSLSLNLESVLEKGEHADFWIGPSQFTSYQQMTEAHSVYAAFDAFQNRQVYTFTAKRGAKGGILYYELAPNRPDLVLKDLIKILHPSLLPDYQLYFFEPLQD